MPNLNIPHVRQAGPTHCGVACLEMIYRYFGITNVTQHTIWQQRKSLRPDGSAEYMSTLNMVNDLVGQGFHVLHGQFSLVPQKCKKSIKRLLNKGTPILACKQWSSNPLYGHFVVIIGLMGDQITYLNPELNSQPQTQNVQQFLTEWQATGQEVIGGQFITMGKDPLPLSINRLHLTQFNVPTKLKDFCLEAVTFTP